MRDRDLLPHLYVFILWYPSNFPINPTIPAKSSRATEEGARALAFCPRSASARTAPGTTAPATPGIVNSTIAPAISALLRWRCLPPGGAPVKGGFFIREMGKENAGRKAPGVQITGVALYHGKPAPARQHFVVGVGRPRRPDGDERLHSVSCDVYPAPPLPVSDDTTRWFAGTAVPATT